jgi:glycine/D-amino acid oxidase-like deaminating enzyme
MILRSLDSYGFVKNGILESYPSLRNEKAEAQIVVIGGGITGALVSHALMELKYNVLLIDKRDIGMGSTAASTSMLQYEIDVPLYELSEIIGEKDAVICYKAGVEALDKLKDLILTNKIDCDWQPKRSLQIAHTGKKAGRLKKEFDIRQRHLTGVDWLESGKIESDYGIKNYGGILSEKAGSIDAYKLTHRLIKHNHLRGMKVFDNTEIIKMDFDPKAPVIYTANNGMIKCEKVIFCTGYESGKLLKETTCALHHTYISLSEQNIKIDPNLKDLLVWDTDDPYTYLRTTSDGRLLIGGADTRPYSPFLLEMMKKRKSKQLQKRLNEIIPGIIFKEDFAWGGVFGSTKDGLPYIGKSPEYESALFVLGYGGNGIIFSTQAMTIIPSLLKGEKNHLSYLYRFGR